MTHYLQETGSPSELEWMVDPPEKDALRDLDFFWEHYQSELFSDITLEEPQLYSSPDLTLVTRRKALSKASRRVLEEWLVQHSLLPYPTREQKADLAQAAHLSVTQVSNWFINARRRGLIARLTRQSVPSPVSQPNGVPPEVNSPKLFPPVSVASDAVHFSPAGALGHVPEPVGHLQPKQLLFAETPDTLLGQISQLNDSVSECKTRLEQLDRHNHETSTLFTTLRDLFKQQAADMYLRCLEQSKIAEEARKSAQERDKLLDRQQSELARLHEALAVTSHHLLLTQDRVAKLEQIIANDRPWIYERGCESTSEAAPLDSTTQEPALLEPTTDAESFLESTSRQLALLEPTITEAVPPLDSTTQQPALLAPTTEAVPPLEPTSQPARLEPTITEAVPPLDSPTQQPALLEPITEAEPPLEPSSQPALLEPSITEAVPPPPNKKGVALSQRRCGRETERHFYEVLDVRSNRSIEQDLLMKKEALHFLQKNLPIKIEETAKLTRMTTALESHLKHRQTYNSIPSLE